MLKKVLSVVLALVLALGVCAVAASAATASQLEDILSHLPNERNAHYYKDATEANILAAREAAYAALESGKTADINAAYALCQAAYDEAWASEEVEYDEWGDTVAVFYNRDESKAHATLYYDTDAPDYLMPGDTFDVTFSIKTDFPLRQFRVSFAYDNTVFEANETPETAGSSISYADAIVDILDTELLGYSTAYGYYQGKRITTRNYYPLEWDAEKQARYNFIEKEFCRNTKNGGADYMLPTEKTEIFTVSMRVKENVALGTTGEIFVAPEMCANMENDYLYDGVPSMPIKIFRGFSTDPNEMVADIDNRVCYAWNVIDEGTGVGQTITFEGTALKTYTIGEEPVVELDYDALEAAVDEAAGYEAAKYTEDSWKTYEDAVAAGAAELEDKALETQDDIDALTKTITDARDALVLAPEEPEEPSEILNITELTVPVVGKYTELEVLISKPVKKIQFIDVNGNTFTYYDGYSRTLDITDNEDGTQTWTVNFTSRAAEESYEVHVKNMDSTWSDKTYTYNATVQTSDNTIFSAEVPDAKETDGRLKYGAHNIVVKTSTDVTKLQVIYNGTTTTYSPSSSKATIEEVDGQLVWTIKQNFYKVGNGLVYQFASRSSTSSWTTSEDVVLTLDVLH